MNRKITLQVGLCLAALLAAQSAVKADQIDEDRMLLDSRINEAIMSEQVSRKDAPKIRKEMANFLKKKTSLFAASGDRFTIEDDAELYKELNKVSQDLVHMKNKEKSKKKSNKPAATEKPSEKPAATEKPAP